jgi:hypothetical protein
MGSEIQKWLFDAYCAAKHIHTFWRARGWMIIVQTGY